MLPAALKPAGVMAARNALATRPAAMVREQVRYCVRGVLSPLLANIYLHYVFDLWLQRWRRRDAKGDVIVVRYADDSVMGFEHEADASRFLEALQVRYAQFGLALNEQKTRVLQFGRFAATQRQRAGLGRPRTFDFLGFTHMCATKRSNGGFTVRRLTSSKRMRATLKAIRQALYRRRHEPIAVVGTWLRRVLQGYFNYHAVPGNNLRLSRFRAGVCRAGCTPCGGVGSMAR
jgi:hypothetical protein